MNSCSICAKPFAAQTTLHTICSPKCLLSRESVNRKAERAERKALKQKLDAIKPRAKWLAEAQQAVNAWVRLRDDKQGCISCGTHAGKMNGGHYLSVGARPELRFSTSNIHKQCERCNTYLHGNLIPYRIELIKRIGQEVVEWLEGPHPAIKLTVDDLRSLRDEYRRKVREMQA